MTLEISIQTRILEKKTGRCISSVDGEDGFLTVCQWSGFDFCDISSEMISICEKYTGINYSASEKVIPVPQAALREIYFYLLKRAYLPDEENFNRFDEEEWKSRLFYENTNLRNAGSLHYLLWQLANIQHNQPLIDEDWISNKNDLELFRENFQDYEWEFKITNSIC